MTDKPLHVQVAEALGCKPETIYYQPVAGKERVWYSCPCKDRIHAYEDDGPSGGCLLDYDSDWSATGPLIEQLGITVEAPTHRDPHWTAALYPMGIMASSEDGPTPLVAVCNLILALHKTGKL